MLPLFVYCLQHTCILLTNTSSHSLVVTWQGQNLERVLCIFSSEFLSRFAIFYEENIANQLSDGSMLNLSPGMYLRIDIGHEIICRYQCECDPQETRPRLINRVALF